MWCQQQLGHPFRHGPQRDLCGNRLKRDISRSFTEDELKVLELKSFGDYKIVGQPVQHLDVPAKTNGTARYGIDVFIPNMVYSHWVSPPVRWGAMPKSVIDTAAKGINGYIGIVVAEDATNAQKGYAIAVAETFHGAKAAADAIKVDWDLGPNAGVSNGDILEHAKSLTDDPNSGLACVLEGDVESGLSGSAATHEAECVTNINYHGVMEPQNAVVIEQGGVWHIFAGSQWQTRGGAIVAKAVGVDPANVMIHQQYLGGGFGRRLEAEQMIPAALAAEELGRPVKLVYTREQDVQFDFHRSLTYQRAKGGVDAAGKPTALDHSVCCGWATKRMAPG